MFAIDSKSRQKMKYATIEITLVCFLISIGTISGLEFTGLYSAVQTYAISDPGAANHTVLQPIKNGTMTRNNLNASAAAELAAAQAASQACKPGLGLPCGNYEIISNGLGGLLL